jgi:hypothetical protein
MKDHVKIEKNYPFKISLKSSYNMYNFKNIYTPVLFFFWWVCVAHLFSFLCCPIMCFYVLSSVFCDVRYDFRIQMVFGSSLPPVVCRRAQILFARFVVSNTYCVVILFFLALCTLCVASFSGLSIFDCSFSMLCSRDGVIRWIKVGGLIDFVDCKSLKLPQDSLQRKTTRA